MRCLDRKRRSKGMEMLMAGQSSDDLLAMFDGAPLNRRYWLSFGLLSAITVLDFFDFFLIAFILSKIGPEWQLTYGQSELILYGGGIGAILGALVWGSLSDVRARKFQIVTGTLIGWRGLAELGVAPAIFGCLVWAFVPESVRWLTAKGRFGEAREEVAKHLGVPLQSVPLPTTAPTSPPSASLKELYANRRLFWQTVIIWGGSSTAAYGYYLWGPTIVALVLNVPVGQAAGYFIYVAGCGVIGKILLSIIAPMTGRRHLGTVFALLAAVSLVLAGIYNSVLIGGFPLMIVLVAASAFFVEGNFSNLAPYTVEQYGVRLGARSSGLGQAANGVGKILGPLALALIAGSDNIVSPKATSDAVLPAFIFLGAGMLLVAAAFAFLGIETHGRPIEELSSEEPAERRPGLAVGTD